MTARDFLRARWLARQASRKGWIGTMLPGPPPMFRVIPPSSDNLPARPTEAASAEALAGSPADAASIFRP
ncbi:MAG: hypothetical protein E6Q97_14595 [Desulfurellales bacterium]|nr:MAG: hypothetical protein E6Q97_14595 [Desulfurellales bacterium]